MLGKYWLFSHIWEVDILQETKLRPGASYIAGGNNSVNVEWKVWVSLALSPTFRNWFWEDTVFYTRLPVQFWLNHFTAKTCGNRENAILFLPDFSCPQSLGFSTLSFDSGRLQIENVLLSFGSSVSLLIESVTKVFCIMEMIWKCI